MSENFFNKIGFQNFMKKVKIAVLSGGVSSEREVSLTSGESVASALAKNFDVQNFVLHENKIPSEINGEEFVVFPAMHGEYGEDGTLQAELEARGIEFAGCASLASRVCMLKPAAKSLMKFAGLNVAQGIEFCASTPPSAEALEKLFPNGAVLKPSDKGSSVGLAIVRDSKNFQQAIDCAKKVGGEFMAEEFIKGREFSIGVLYGKPCRAVEIIPDGGVYDYARKYTSGSTRYEFPAKIDEACAGKMCEAAARAFAACSCRDFARVDFILSDEKNADFAILEINTLPGMTPTSLLPKSAACCGLDFDELCANMMQGALERHSLRWR